MNDVVENPLKKYIKKLDEEFQEARETLNFIMEQLGL